VKLRAQLVRRRREGAPREVHYATCSSTLGARRQSRCFRQGPWLAGYCRRPEVTDKELFSRCLQSINRRIRESLILAIKARDNSSSSWLAKPLPVRGSPKHKTGLAWVRQFSTADQRSAAELLDALLLLSEREVSDSILRSLSKIASSWSDKKRHPVALYAEREMAEARVFEVKPILGLDGKLHQRAVGPGPAPVKPRRGKRRVGSEGPGAFLISQAVTKHRRVFMNHPSPDQIRSRKVRSIVIVTDFIGSGTRVTTFLDRFWRVTSVRAWWSRGWVKFGVVACAGTRAGIAAVELHAAKPRCTVEHIVPTVEGQSYPNHVRAWRHLIANYGPPEDPRACRLRVQGHGRASRV
jgi:hypothetical protein